MELNLPSFSEKYRGVRMLKLPTITRTPLVRAARGMAGPPSKLECFIDGKKVESRVLILLS